MRLPLRLAAALLCCACTTSGRPHPHAPPVAGEPSSSPLFRDISRADAELSGAFNAHDLTALMDLFSEDLEFYHDAGGLQRYPAVKAGFDGLFARHDGIRRELLPGTMRVYPIPGHGALELGSHRFCHRENERTDCGTFEFVQIWRQEAGRWKIARVVSYGH